MGPILATTAVQVFAGAALLGVLALLVHLTTDDADGGWLMLARVLGVVTR